MATCNNNNIISLLTSETNLLGADNNQTGKVLTGEDEADNHEINIDRAIKGSCESSRVEPFICVRLHSADLVSRSFIIKK
jgi:hypothetical protein